MARELSVLALEPWLGGSHERFLAQWCARSRHAVRVVGLPARHWKWRLASAGWRLAQLVERARVPRPDVLLVGSFTDLPQLYGFLPPDWGGVPALYYFHENQLTFPLAPGVDEASRDRTHGTTQLLSCVRAGAVAFNSAYQRDEVRRASADWLARLPHPRPRAAVAAALDAARVLWPGVELEALPPGPGGAGSEPLRVAFPHRLEHDKDPQAAVRACRAALDAGARLRLVLLGARFERAPAGLREALEDLGPALEDVGFVERREDFARHLGTTDLVLSTARHEFYGMAVLEGLAVGAGALCPRRLSYPEVLPVDAPGVRLHDDPEGCVRALVEWAADPTPLRDPAARAARRAAVAGHDAAACARALDDALEQLVGCA